MTTTSTLRQKVGEIDTCILKHEKNYLIKNFIVPIWINGFQVSCQSIVLTNEEEVHSSKGRLLVDPQVTYTIQLMTS